MIYTHGKALLDTPTASPPSSYNHLPHQQRPPQQPPQHPFFLLPWLPVWGGADRVSTQSEGMVEGGSEEATLFSMYLAAVI